MKKSLLVMTALLSVNASAAMILGFGAEADYLTMSANGGMSVSGSVTTFNSDYQKGYQIGAFFEHPVPLIPNIRVDYTSDLEFKGVGANAKLNQTDITPYYEILDNIVDIDIGITAKSIKGELVGVADGKLDTIIPMGYVGVGAMIPLFPVSLAGSVKYVSFSGDEVIDARVKAMYKIVGGLALQGGYRYESIKLDDRAGITADTKFKGYFGGVSYTF